jgi:hypothetical protein
LVSARLRAPRRQRPRSGTRTGALSEPQDRAGQGGYGVVTAKALVVLEALLWAFHNAKSGLCFPFYEKIAEAAGCARSTVAEAIRALEDTGIMSWVQRIKRVRERCSDLLGDYGWRWRVLRTSNAYNFRDPGAPLPLREKVAFLPSPKSRLEHPIKYFSPQKEGASAITESLPPRRLGQLTPKTVNKAPYKVRHRNSGRQRMQADIEALYIVVCHFAKKFDVSSRTVHRPIALNFFTPLS